LVQVRNSISVRQAVIGRQVAEQGVVVAQAIPVGIVRLGQQMPGAKFGGGLEHGQEVVDPRRGGKASQFDIQDGHARVGDARLGLAQHPAILDDRKGVAGRHFGQP
jgi:hypothetical protein